MREDLSKIVVSLINGVAGTSLTEPVCEGLNTLKEQWPGLTQTEKEELASVILSLRTIEDEYNQKCF